MKHQELRELLLRAQELAIEIDNEMIEPLEHYRYTAVERLIEQAINELDSQDY